MICDKCGEKEANVHLTKIVNGEKNEIYLCENCASQSNEFSFGTDHNFTFQNLLAGILSPAINNESSQNNLLNNKVVCNKCNSSYQEFSQKGLFGCAECYDIFENKLESLMKRIHGNTEHSGKVPQRRGGRLKLKRKINDLRDQMQEAIAMENFEKAAILRDQIHEIDSEMEGEVNGEH